MVRTLGIAAALAAASIGTAVAGEAGPTVVELFTSQGCNSCPPAEALLGELAQRPDVVALEFHVDYWDRLGWADPFATAWGTDRQYRYADALDQGTVYTPQMIVDGTGDVVGSRRAEVLALIAASQATAARLAVTMAVDGDGVLRVSVPAAASDGPAKVWLFRYDGVHRTAVARGENGGRELVNYNVARERWLLGEWDGAAASFEAAVERPGETGGGYAVIVQSADHGPILGAAKLELPAS